LSATKQTVEEENDQFRGLWKQPACRNMRTRARHSFELAIVLLMAAAVIIVHHKM
jgi:hypothetical protein